MRFFFLLTLISISINCFSQRANHIVFGGGNVLTTTTSNPEISGAIFFSNFHTTSISDSSGNLLFYSNGSSTYGRDINMNFDRYAGMIHPGASQDLPCLLIPKPGNDTLYYLFTIENDLSGVLKSHLYLSELNAASGFGQGGFTKNINRSIQTNVNGLLAATQHCNGINTWILVHETNTNRFFAYLVTEDGISFTPVISEIGPSNAMYNGTMVFSPNGKLLAVGHTTEYLPDEQYQNIIQLYDFDNATGKISNQRVYSKLNTPTCPTFSNNSQFLYTVALDENPDVYDPTHLFQFDLRNNDYQLANPQIVYSFKTYQNTNAGGESPTAQLASNGKIYCFDILYGKYYEVQNPNIAGPSCTVKEVYKDMPNGSLKVFFNVISNYLDSSYTEKKAKIFIENICYGNPTKFKVNSSIAFDAINWTFENRSSKYKIESNSISPAINFSEGEYIANAIIKGNCTTDTIKAYFAIKKQTLMLPSDTSLCSNKTFFLKPQGTIKNYFWQDGSQQDSFLIQKEGTYWVRSTDEDCPISDSIKISFKTAPEIQLGRDTTICTNSSLMLKPNNSSIVRYVWQDGSQNTFINAEKEGKYWVNGWHANGCMSTDTIEIYLHSLPEFSLGSDTTLCEKQTKQYFFNLTGATYLWSNNQKTGSYTIAEGGLHWLEITQNGCSRRDSILISYKPAPVVHLGTDTTLCEGTTLLLDATHPNSKYQWQNNASLPVFLVNKPGLYHVKVEKDGCFASDSINVSYQQKPVFTLGNDTLLCSGQSIILKPNIAGINAYLWQDGSTSSTFTVTNPGLYKVTITNGCGSKSDEIVISKSLCKIIMPTAFTPNHDGLNDVFRVKYPIFIKTFYMTIFNRWGEVVYQSTDAHTGWDGKFRKVQQPQGNYIWVIKFTDIEGNCESIKGNVLLIR